MTQNALKRADIVEGSLIKIKATPKLLRVNNIIDPINGNPRRYHAHPVGQKEYQLFCPTFNQITELIIIKN